MNNLLTCRDLSKTYCEGTIKTTVLKGVNFNLAPGELTAIVGASGSGKSTLLHILGTLDTPTTGRVNFLNKDVFALSSKEQDNFRNKSLGFIYQFHHLLGDFTAIENVTIPLLIAGYKSSEALQQASVILERVGLKNRLEHRPSELSGGERQRVAIARALVNKPALVLADEPTGNLDQTTAVSIYNLMRELNDEYKTAFLVVTHDMQLAGKFDKQLAMSDGILELPEVSSREL